MKYCPNCGCKLSDDALTCCIECGEELPIIKKKRKKNRKQQNTIMNEKQDESYDGYYDDRKTVDEDELDEEVDKTLLRNVILVLSGVLVIVSVCVFVLFKL